MAIKNFTHKGLEKFFKTGSVKSILPHHKKKIALVLDQLDSANEPKDLNFPGSDFHPLKGKLKSFYSIHVSGNWVIIFRFQNGNAYDVNYLDYH